MIVLIRSSRPETHEPVPSSLSNPQDHRRSPTRDLRQNWAGQGATGALVLFDVCHSASLSSSRPVSATDQTGEARRPRETTMSRTQRRQRNESKTGHVRGHGESMSSWLSAAILSTDPGLASGAVGIGHWKRCRQEERRFESIGVTSGGGSRPMPCRLISQPENHGNPCHECTSSRIQWCRFRPVDVSDDKYRVIAPA